MSKKKATIFSQYNDMIKQSEALAAKYGNTQNHQVEMVTDRVTGQKRAQLVVMQTPKGDIKHVGGPCSLLSTDESMHKEVDIEQADKEMDLLKLSTFKIHRYYFEFNKNDKIFNLTDKAKGKVKLQECNSCKNQRFEKEKDMHFCEFCTRANCKNCCEKTRCFPKAIPNKKGEVKRGTICVLCDRKFLIREMLAEQHKELEEKDAMEYQLEIDMKKEEREMTQVAMRRNQVKWAHSDKIVHAQQALDEQSQKNVDLYMQQQKLKNLLAAKKLAKEQREAKERARQEEELKIKMAKELADKMSGDEKKKALAAIQIQEANANLLRIAEEQKRKVQEAALDQVLQDEDDDDPMRSQSLAMGGPKRAQLNMDQLNVNVANQQQTGEDAACCVLF